MTRPGAPYKKEFCQKFGDNYEGWIVVARLAEWGGWMDFEIFDTITDMDDACRPAFTIKSGCGATDGIVGETDGAQAFADGYIKWDGCSQFDLHSGHFCGRDAAQRVSKIMESVYDIAMEHMNENAKEYLA